MGLISLSANSRAIVWIICCSSVNVSRIVIRPYYFSSNFLNSAVSAGTTSNRSATIP